MSRPGEAFEKPDKRVPPQATEAEAAVLGAILFAGEAGRAVELLQPGDFYRPVHREVFSAMLRLFQKGEAIDVITLSDELKAMGKLEEVGGPMGLTGLLEAVATSANLEYHAKIVLEKSILRKLIQTSAEIAGRGYESGVEADQLLDEAEQLIFKISETRVRTGFVHVKEILKDSFEQIQKLQENKEHGTGLKSGFPDLDSKTAGFQRSDLIIVAGRPSMGKTSFALSVMQNVATESNLPVGIFSLEMSKEQLVQRLLCSLARVDAHRLRTGYLRDTEWPQLTTAAGFLNEAPIYIDDTPSMNVLEMRAKARRLKAEANVGLIVVDYLQLMVASQRTENRQQEISSISRSLKALAKELDLPVLALSQLSRAVESRGGDHRPLLSDLRESGALEQDADVVLFVYRPEFYFPENEEHEGIAEIIIGKQRNGPLGTVKLAFIKNYTRFENLAAESMA